MMELIGLLLVLVVQQILENTTTHLLELIPLLFRMVLSLSLMLLSVQVAADHITKQAAVLVEHLHIEIMLLSLLAILSLLELDLVAVLLTTTVNPVKVVDSLMFKLLALKPLAVVAVVPLVVGHLEELRVEPTMVAVKEVAADLVTAV
tara:strand:+ start:115 stop:558 length:444 start_codon:yes stop_codon:yes gene_type:complete